MKDNKKLPDRFYFNKKIKSINEIFNDSGLLKIKKHKFSITAYQKVWENFIDSNINKHGRVVGVKNGVVVIEIDSHVWLHHITNFCKDEIVISFQNCKDIKFVSDVKFRLKS